MQTQCTTRMNQPRGFQSPQPRRGFTLTELLVVIAVMILLFTIAVPNVKKLIGSGDVDAATNILSSAVAAARAYASSPPVMKYNRTYAGAAIYITPANELRFIQCISEAKYGSSWQEVKDGSGTLNKDHSAYADIASLRYLHLPKYVGVIGVLRGGSGSGELQFIAPPFALRFDGDGHMIVRNYNSSAAHIYSPTAITSGPRYHSSYDRSRITYNPEVFDPDSPRYTTAGLPQIEAFESVVGVILYNKQDFWDADPGNVLASEYATSSATFSDAGAQWIADNGTPIFFNRYTGAVLSKP